MDIATASTGPFEPTLLHTRLARLAGGWKGTAKTFFDPNQPEVGETAAWEGTVTTLLGGRFWRFTYTSTAMGQPIAGELTVAYEKGDRLYRMSWIDSLHTSPAILVSEGKLPGDESTSSAVSAVGTYFAGEDQPRWGWRTEIDISENGELLLRMYNVTPSGGESIAIDVVLTRG